MHTEINFRIEQLRERLNEMNATNAPFETILKLSEELDAWIVCSYEV